MVLTYSYYGPRNYIDYALRDISDAMQRSVENGDPFQHNGQKYPAMIVGCHKKDKDYWIIDSARSPVNYPFVDELRNALTTLLGPIGTTSQLCSNVIGQCAEPHAANEILLAENCLVDDLDFSFAMRPRTQTFYPYCLNCKRVFNL